MNPGSKDDAWCPSLGSSDGADHHRSDNGGLHLHSTTAMGATALASEVFSPSQLHFYVRVVVPDSEEFLPGSEGTWIRTPRMETGEKFI